MRGRSILIVDDDPDHVETLATLLESAGHRVERATSPLYALTLVRRLSPEVVILDIGMPNLNGYEVLARLKRHFTRARFYAVTGHSGDDWRKKSIEAGFDDHFVKPMDLGALDALLKD